MRTPALPSPRRIAARSSVWPLLAAGLTPLAHTPTLPVTASSSARSTAQAATRRPSYTRDFIELYNPTGSASTSAACRSQYRSGRGCTGAAPSASGRDPCPRNGTT